MATFLKRVFDKRFGELSLKYGAICLAIRNTRIVVQKKPKPGTIRYRNLIKSTGDSLAAKGFLRSVKPYEPPADVNDKLSLIYKSTFGSNTPTVNLNEDRKLKYTLLNKCFQEFKHSVPNSLLHTIETINDVTQFYQTPVKTTTPYDDLKNMDLPPNLYVQQDYVRFHPDTDTKFNGITAFPESSTIVTGLRAKEKYKGHRQKLPEHYNNWASFIKT